MRTLKLIVAGLCLSLAACNSGNSNQSGSDSAMTGKDTSAKMADTSHMAMNDMSSMQGMCVIPAGAKVFFKNLKDGEKVASPVKVEMGIEGMMVDTAGAIKNNSGHFHLLIDAEDSIPSGTIVPKDSTHLHFGKAQTETDLKLAPGKHKIVLQFADGIHRSYGAKLATEITIDVKK
jgi:hypothetical protein